MSYSESSKLATIKYLKENTKRIEVRYTKDEYESRIRPEIEKTGEPVATFIKKAIDERIERLNAKG